MLICSPSKKGDGTRGTPLECLVSPGESGGGMFIAGKLAGIHSVLTTKSARKVLDGGYDNVCGCTRVSMYADWITKTANELESHFSLIDDATDAIKKLK